LQGLRLGMCSQEGQEGAREGGDVRIAPSSQARPGTCMRVAQHRNKSTAATTWGAVARGPSL